MAQNSLRHFYIPEEQSFYLLSHADAQKLKDWFDLCRQQLNLLGYKDIEFLGKGAFGFVFAGTSDQGQQRVFKFSRITLPQHVQDRLEDEAFMLAQVDHCNVPALIEFQRVRKQAILVMERASGMDLEKYSLRHGPLPARLIVKIAAQVVDILTALRQHTHDNVLKPIVHGDVKPSNLIFDPDTEKVALVDWGSCVYAQLDEHGQHINSNIMDLMSGDLQQTNARLGDVYFIGEEQLQGALSSVRFDEQGLAGTLYALASGQSCRFGNGIITPQSLGLPQELANVLSAMLSKDPQTRRQAGDYLFKHMARMRHIQFADDPPRRVIAVIPSWLHNGPKDIETVVYSSRKSFLRQESEQVAILEGVNDEQLDRYYKNYMQGMGDNEKAFISAVSRLGNYPVVGGLAVRWEQEGVFIDSSLNLYDPSLKPAFDAAINTMVTLARGIDRKGIFKCCMFNAKDTLHVERMSPMEPFVPEEGMRIPFEISQMSLPHDESRMHSYFEDGDDPDELLRLPTSVLSVITQLNHIQHTGCIIFEVMPLHLKVHNYYTLLDHGKKQVFEQLLEELISLIPTIEGVGISGFMKLPYKDTRFFSHIDELAESYYSNDPKGKRRKLNN